MSSLHDWARWWVALGCAVFPLPPLKKKATNLGITSATIDLAQIERWWTAEPNSNIGVVGNPAATERFLLRVDVDVKNGGSVAWSRLLTSNPTPLTLTVRTPSGGHHYYFTTSRPYGNSTGSLPDGIDIRGHSSGYTVGAASMTAAVPGESTAGHYALEVESGMAAAPDWLITMLGDQRQTDSEPLQGDISDETYQELRSALMSPGMLKDWSRWSDNGLALRTLGDRGQSLWVEFSRRQLEVCNQEQGTDTAETWWARHRPAGIKSDYRSIFTRAQALGWKNPRAVDPSTLGFGVANLTQPQVAQGAVSQPRFKLLTEDEFSEGPDPEWRIDGLLPEQGLGMIFGPSGCGKSFFTLDMLMHVADGQPYGSDQRRVKQGRVVYVMAEGAGGMRQRIRAYRHKTPAKHDRFKIIAAAPNLMSPADVGEMTQVIMEHGGADVIVFDTLHASMAGGDENSAKDMGVLLSNARAIAALMKCMVIFIHHSGKDESKGARGSSAIRGAMETQIEISVSSHDARKRSVTIAKQRDGDDNMAWEFELEPIIIMGDRPCASAVVRHSQAIQSRESKSGKARSSKSKDCVVDMVASLRNDYPNGVPFEILVASVGRVRVDMRAGNIRRSITRAIDAGLLTIDDETVVNLRWQS